MAETDAKTGEEHKIETGENVVQSGQSNVNKDIVAKNIPFTISKDATNAGASTKGQKIFATTLEHRNNQVNKYVKAPGKDKKCFLQWETDDETKVGNCRLIIDPEIVKIIKGNNEEEKNKIPMRERIEDLLKVLPEKNGTYGIEYINGIPDFSPVAMLCFTADYSRVRTEEMTKDDARDAVQADSLDRAIKYIKGNSNAKKDLGIVSKVTKKEFRKCSSFDRYSKMNLHDDRATLHETSDLEYELLVPFVVNDTFGHCGAIAEVNAGALFEIPQEDKGTENFDSATMSGGTDIKNGVKLFASGYKYPSDLDANVSSKVVSQQGGTVP